MAEWDAEHHVDAELAQTLIGSQFPELREASIEHLAEGWDNVVYLVDGRWVFRFPRREIAIAGVEREIEVLGRLSAHLPLAIPSPRFVGAAANGYPWPWYGAAHLPGVELAEAGLPDDERVELGRQVGDFLGQLHAPALMSRIGAGLPVDPMRRADMTVRVPAARRRLDELAASRLWRETREVSELLDDAASLPPPSTTVVAHGDLHARHLLVDGGGAATAVIDWGDVCVADPSVDLSVAYGSFAGAARSALLDAYGGPPDGLTELRARVIAVFLAAALFAYADDRRLASLRAESLRSLERATTR